MKHQAYGGASQLSAQAHSEGMEIKSEQLSIKGVAGCQRSNTGKNPTNRVTKSLQGQLNGKPVF